MSEDLTQRLLKELLHYCPETGVFTRVKALSSRVKIGDVAGWESKGRIRVCVNGDSYEAGRLAWLYVYGYFPEHEVEHKDRIATHNWIDNLREATHQCNLRNVGVRVNNSSGVTGVGWSTAAKKWTARIKVSYKELYLGVFVELRDAARARWEAEVKYNFPNCNTTSSAFMFLKESGDV